MTTLTGRCLCGAVRIAIDGQHDGDVGACHCHMCQRWAGGLFVCFAVAPDAVTVSGPVTRHPSSSFAERAFCATCGSHLWMRDTDRAEAPYDVMPGLFADASGFPLTSEIYIDQAPAYLRLAGDHKKQTAAEYEAEWPSVDEGDTP